MAKKPVIHRKTEIDPLFFIPEGVEEIGYIPEGYGDASASEEMVEDYYDSFEDISTDDSVSPETPGINGVVSQVIRRLPSGQQRVDVVLDVDEMPGMSNYEFRVTKA